DDEQGSPSPPGFEGVGGRLHRVPTVRDRTERGRERRPQMVEQTDSLRVPASSPVPGDRNVGGGGKPGEERALPGSGRGDDESNPVLPDPVEETVDALAGEGMHMGYQHLGRYHGRGPLPHAGPPLFPYRSADAGVATAPHKLTPTVLQFTSGRREPHTVLRHSTRRFRIVNMVF